MTRGAIILTVDNGGTNTRVARGAERIEQVEAYATPQKYEEAIERIAATARLVLGGRRPDAVGFSVAGKVEDGCIVSAGELQKYGWSSRPFAADVASVLGISPDRIVLLNDCAAGANAERHKWQPKDGEVGAFMVLSTGFGAALYTCDELIADEPGHYHLKPGAICGDGQDGHMEAHIGGAGITRKHGARGEEIAHDDPRWQEVKDDFHESIMMTLERYERELGMTLQTVGFTGSVAFGGPAMLDDLQHYLDVHMQASPRIVPAAYGDQSGLYGAAFAAAELLRNV